ncbi:MAG: amidohydrolase family protein, partial [Myxococcota bacterium]|nr:amidohydrolase family protein [Myxococcota bacterium]
MTHRGIVLWCSVLLLAAALAACDDDPKNPPGPDQEISPDQEDGDILPDGDVEVSPDAEVEETPDDTDTPDDETDVVEPDRVTCSRTIPASTNGVCSIAAGSSKMVILEGTVLAGNKIYENGRVLFDSSNRNGRISCVGCDCEDASATVVSCAKGVISPSLINTHDHITFCEAAPATHPQERYEHRHDWRKGLRSHTKLPVSGGANVTYGELRMLFGGTTSIAGSGSAPGLLRNLDRSDDLEGLQGIDVDYRTFPLGDSGGTQLSTGCGYPSIDSESRARSAGIYHAHISEGIDDVTRNEFVCTSANNGGGQDLVNENTSIVHAVGLRAIDVQTMADEGAKLIWSPRSNVDLYGNTAQVVLFRNLGVTISLGTDWSASGSINMLRELQCADYLNRNHYNNTFSDYELWMMATYNGAIATGAETQIGLLATGYVADIAVFDGSTHKDYRAVIDAEVSDVNLVFRGGQALLADAPLMATLRGSEASNCENVDVCGVSKSICLKLETGMTLSALKAQVGGAYGLFYCDTPPNEPSCVPWRKNEYEGISSPDDPDGDGIANSEDNCPLIFNPVRNKLDIGGQGDADNDGIGDACDRCPLNEGEECGAPAPDDRDRDGVKDFEDNCPANPNPDQDDRDNDQIGDVCDLCPDDANPNGAACPATVYAVKRGEIPQGTPVSITGLVATAVTTDGKGIFAQADPSDPNVFSGADFSGIYVYLGSGFTGAAPTRGQRFDVEGTIGAYFDQIQLSAITSISIDSTYSAGEPAPVVVEPALVATGGSRADALEAVLVDVGSVTVLSTSPTPGFAGHNVENEFDVSGNLRVDNFLYTVTPMPAESSTITSLKGVVRWGNSLSNLLPRDGSDVITGPATLSEIQPTVAYLAAGTTANTIPEMQLVMTRNVDADAVITLSYDNPTVLSGPASVTVPMGTDRVALQLTAGGASATPATFTATYSGVEKTASVIVYDDAV